MKLEPSKIEGSRVYLREANLDDCKTFAEWETIPDVTEFFTISKGRDYAEVSEEFLNRHNDDDKIEIAICLKEDDSLIGRIYISDINRHYDSMDITRIYIADKSMRGRGLGRDALRCCLKLGFEEMGLERITLDYFTGNDTARDLYLKEGFVPEGCMRHGGKKDGHYIDLNLMSILRKEYFEKR